MDNIVKLTNVHRLLTGITILHCRNDDNILTECMIVPAKEEDIAIASQKSLIFYEENSDIITHEQMLEYMLENDLWSIEKSDLLQSLPKNIEVLKIELYNSYFKSKRKDTIKKQLLKCKEEFLNLSNEKYAYYENTIEGMSELRFKSEVLRSRIRDMKNNHILDIGDNFLHSIIFNYNRYMINDDDLRLMSRTEPWRTYWNISENIAGLFHLPIVCLDEQQKSIALWSKLYDSVYENPESPPESVIEEDDVLDGWLLLQNQKNKADKERAYGESFIPNKSKKQGGNQEVFIPTETPEDARKVNALNNPEAKFIKKQRMRNIEEKGQMKEQDMPDSQLTMRTQAQRMLSEKFKRK